MSVSEIWFPLELWRHLRNGKKVAFISPISQNEISLIIQSTSNVNFLSSGHFRVNWFLKWWSLIWLHFEFCAVKSQRNPYEAVLDRVWNVWIVWNRTCIRVNRTWSYKNRVVIRILYIRLQHGLVRSHTSYVRFWHGWVHPCVCHHVRVYIRLYTDRTRLLTVLYECLYGLIRIRHSYWFFKNLKNLIRLTRIYSNIHGYTRV